MRSFVELNPRQPVVLLPLLPLRDLPVLLLLQGRHRQILLQVSDPRDTALHLPPPTNHPHQTRAAVTVAMVRMVL